MSFGYSDRNFAIGTDLAVSAQPNLQELFAQVIALSNRQEPPLAPPYKGGGRLRRVLTKFLNYAILPKND